MKKMDKIKTQTKKYLLNPNYPQAYLLRDTINNNRTSFNELEALTKKHNLDVYKPHLLNAFVKKYTANYKDMIPLKVLNLKGQERDYRILEGLLMKIKHLPLHKSDDALKTAMDDVGSYTTDKKTIDTAKKIISMANQLVAWDYSLGDIKGLFGNAGLEHDPYNKGKWIFNHRINKFVEAQ